ncbi:hypothetical protein AUK45_01820 [Candidatus Peregrinibacteria bacterium CG2_30_44_17]|nr:MAG: hypothetical protein AUK45_01820 [Candidatus Peregrinibacteria bacterium CG2_30_44_17]
MCLWKIRKTRLILPLEIGGNNRNLSENPRLPLATTYKKRGEEKQIRARVVKHALGLVGPKRKFYEPTRGLFLRTTAGRGIR